MVPATRLALSLIAAALIVACSSKPTQPVISASDAETAAMAPLKADYPDIVISLDPSGTTLEVKEEPDGLVWDRVSQETFNADGLKLWRAAWRASNPNRHATLRLRLVSYRGPLIGTETTRV